MKHNIPHALSLPLARLVTAKALSSYVERYPEFHPTGEWLTPDRAAFQLQARGLHVNGTIDVGATAVVFELDFPLLLEPFKKGVVRQVEEEVLLWLKWAKEGRFDTEVAPEARAVRTR